MEKVELAENALTILQNRYLRKDADGKLIETPEGLFERVSKYISSNEKDSKYKEEFYEIMTKLYFLPNTPTLLNAGIGKNLSGCFVLPVPDDLKGILKTLTDSVLIHSSGGGTGFSFSRLRPKGSMVGASYGAAAGPIQFMTIFNASTETIKQSGVRRGANMGILRVDHPDIIEFINCKSTEGFLNNFNLSIAITDKFIEAVQKNTDFELIDPNTKKVAKKIKAKVIFDNIINNAWLNGEPGLIFIDRVNKFNPVPHLGEIEATNPCGEMASVSYASCNLGSINLSKMVKDKEIDHDLLSRVVKLAVRFLDNVIDLNEYPIPEIEDMTKRIRPIGLGVMGFADMLLKMEVSYNSRHALEIAEEVMKTISDIAWETSADLAEEKGEFPEFKKSRMKKRKRPVRNCFTTVIAPTGSLSIIANCSSGIEPNFSFNFVSQQGGAELKWIHPEYAKHIGGTIPDYFVSAHQIPAGQHVSIQASFQRYVDNSISKTVNFANEATIDDVIKVFWKAWELGCKGITVYRDGSREQQVLYHSKKKGISPKPRPKRTFGVTDKVAIGCGNLFITANKDEEGNLCEIFADTGKFGGCPSQSEAIARLVSLGLRCNIDPVEISDQLKIKCPSASGEKKPSCPMAISKMLIENIPNLVSTPSTPVAITSNEVCPDCKAVQPKTEGCFTCRVCGYQKCK